MSHIACSIRRRSNFDYFKIIFLSLQQSFRSFFVGFDFCCFIMFSMKMPGDNIKAGSPAIGHILS